MPFSKDVYLNIVSVKSFAELQEYLAKKSDKIEISKGIIIPADIAQNQRKETYRRLIIAMFNNKQLYLNSIKENKNEQSNEDNVMIGFSFKKPDTIIFDDPQETKHHYLQYEPEKFIELGLRQFRIYSEIQSMDFKDKRLVPLNTVVQKMWNGGAMVGGKEDPLEPCVSASTVIEHPFIFKGTEIPEHPIKIKPTFKCDSHMILISASRMIPEEVGVPCLVVDTDDSFCAQETAFSSAP
jgi:hypothetical protein